MSTNSNTDGHPSFAVQGIGLGTYSQGGYADSTVGDFVTSAKNDGANYVELSNIVLADLKTGAIGDVVENGVDQTAPLADVGRAAGLAEAAGLNVMLKPQIAVHDPAYAQYNSASWINMVDPDLVIADPARFFANYKAQLLQWAQVAEQNHVALLSVGNEMVAATKPQYTGYWNDIIDSVRQVYHGALTYSALAPVMTNASVNEISQIGFWSKLDYAGFDVYPSLVETTAPTVAQLAAGWHNDTVYGHPQDYAAFLGSMASAVGKPVIFTETGLPSFDGASNRQATSDGDIGDGVHPADQHEQADWWQAFFQTWAVNKPSWLAGVIVNNNDPGNLGGYYDTNYNINGKLAEPVVAAWYGGKTVIGAGATSLAGSQADDQLYLFGPNRGASQAASLSTTVTVKLTAAILGGASPVLHAYINGVDEGQFALKPVDSGYVNSAGVHFSADQNFSFSLPGLVSVNQLKIAMDSAAAVGGQASTTFFNEVSVNGIALTGATYAPASGGAYAEALPSGGSSGSASHWNGGAITFDATPWNTALAARTVGTASNPIVVSGMGGTDTVHVLGPAEDYTVTRIDAASVRLAESSGLGQNAILQNIAAVTFGDGVQVSLGSLQAGVDHHFGGPVIATALADATAQAGAGFSYVVPTGAFTDPDGDALSYSLTLADGSAAPAWLTFDAAKGVITGTPPGAGAFDLKVTAADPQGASIADVFHLTIAAAPAAPTGTPTPAPTPAAGQVLQADSAHHALVGGAGADTLVADHGGDTLTGGAGADQFVFGVRAWSASEITDFATGTDKLDFSRLLGASGYGGSDPIADGYVKLIDNGAGGTWVYYDSDGKGTADRWGTFTVTLDHVAAKTLHATDLVGAAAAASTGGAGATGGTTAPPPSTTTGAATGTGTGAAAAGQMLQADPSHRILSGGAGADTLVADHGPDTLSGGAGADHFVFNSAAWSASEITDFAAGTDKLDFSAFLNASGYKGSDPIADGYVKAIGNGAGGTWIYYDSDGKGTADPWGTFVVTLDHVAPSSLGAGDFIVH